MQHPAKFSSFIAIPLLAIATACSGVDNVAFTPSPSDSPASDAGAGCVAPSCSSTSEGVSHPDGTGGAHSTALIGNAGGVVGGSGGSPASASGGAAAAGAPGNGSSGAGAGGATHETVPPAGDSAIEVATTDGPSAIVLHAKSGAFTEAPNGLSLTGDVTLDAGDDSVPLTDAKLSLTLDGQGHVTDVSGTAKIYVPKVSLQVLTGGFVTAVVHLDASHEHRLCTVPQTPLDKTCIVFDIDNASATAIGTLGLGLGLGAEVVVTPAPNTGVLQAKLSGNALLDIPASLCATIPLQAAQ